jgi:hypothetical protein
MSDTLDIILRRIADEQHLSYRQVVNLALVKGIETLQGRQAPGIVAGEARWRNSGASRI